MKMGHLAPQFRILTLALLAGCALAAAPRAALADGYYEEAMLQPNPAKVAQETPPSGPLDKSAQETLFWQSAEKSGSVAEYKAYLDAFPNGVYAPLAKNRIEAASDAPAPSPTTVSPEALKSEIGTMETEQSLNLNRRDLIVLQQRLAALGLSVGPIDGDLGPASRTAIAAWQQSHGMAATGQLGPLLVATLKTESGPVNGQRVEGNTCPTGFHPGPYGRRCWVNQ
jgi:hypothetical protein